MADPADERTAEGQLEALRILFEEFLAKVAEGTAEAKTADGEFILSADERTELFERSAWLGRYIGVLAHILMKQEGDPQRVAAIRALRFVLIYAFFIGQSDGSGEISKKLTPFLMNKAKRDRRSEKLRPLHEAQIEYLKSIPGLDDMPVDKAKIVALAEWEANGVRPIPSSSTIRRLLVKIRACG